MHHRQAFQIYNSDIWMISTLICSASFSPSCVHSAEVIILPRARRPPPRGGGSKVQISFGTSLYNSIMIMINESPEWDYLY